MMGIRKDEGGGMDYFNRVFSLKVIFGFLIQRKLWNSIQLKFKDRYLPHCFSDKCLKDTVVDRTCHVYMFTDHL